MAFDTALLWNYVLCFVSGIGIIAFMLRGFILPWWRVKRSGGSKLLVRIRNPLQWYYAAGTVDKSWLYFTGHKRKDNPKASRMIFIGTPENWKNNDKSRLTIFGLAVYKSFGVMCIDVDDEKDCVFYLDQEQYMAVPGFNSELNDEAMSTALNKPSLSDGLFDPKMFQIITLLGIVALGIGLYMVYDQGKLIDAHLKTLYDTLKPMSDQMFQVIPK